MTRIPDPMRRLAVLLVAACMLALFGLGAPARATAADATGSVETSPSEPTTPASSVTTIGASVRGLPIKAWTFGDGARHLLIIGGVHGNESGDNVATALVAYLLANPSAVPTGTQIHVIVCLNPDGAKRGIRGNVRKVDLNRNMPTSDWRRVLDRHDLSRKLHLTGGSKRASEPETRALLDYVAATPFECVVVLHSRAALIDTAGPGARVIGARLSKASGLRLGKVAYDKYIHGSMGQYFSKVVGVPTITVELKSAKLTKGLRTGLLGVLQ